MKRIAAIGMFDGVHLGHRHLLQRLRSEAASRGLEPMVVSFANHPLEVVRPDAAPALLSTPAEKEALLRAEGVMPLILPFDGEMRLTTTAQFMRQLHDRHDVRAILLGFNNHFGHDRPASFEGYEDLGRSCGVEVLAADELHLPGDARVSSSAIRRLIAEGRVDGASNLLGRPYSFDGTVVSGRQLGRTIGFPTANVLPDSPRKLIPPDGVYAVDIAIEGDSEPLRRAVMNIGSRPTVSGHHRTIEVHIPAFSGDIYGCHVHISVLRRLRPEQRFPSLDLLRRRIALDVAEALAL